MKNCSSQGTVTMINGPEFADWYSIIAISIKTSINMRNA